MTRRLVLGLVLAPLCACGGATPAPVHTAPDTAHEAPRAPDPSWPEAIVRQWDVGQHLVFAREGALLVAAGPLLCAIDTSTGHVVATTEYGSAYASARIVVAPDDDTVLVGDTRWSLRTGAVDRFRSYDALESAASDELADGYAGPVGVVAIPGLSRFLATPAPDVLWLTDAEGEVLARPLDEGQEGDVAAIDPTGATFVVEGDDTFTLRAADDGRVIATQQTSTFAPSYAPDGSLVLLAGEESWQLLVPTTGEQVASSERPIGNTRWTSAWLAPSGTWVLLATSTSLGVLDLRDRTIARSVPVAYEGFGGERDPSALEGAVELIDVWPLAELGAVGARLHDREGSPVTMQLLDGPELTPAAGRVESDRGGGHRLVRTEHAASVRSGEVEIPLPGAFDVAARVDGVVLGPRGLVLQTLNAAIELGLDGTVTRLPCFEARPRLGADGTVRWASDREVCGPDGTRHPLPGVVLDASRDGSRLLVGDGSIPRVVVDGSTGALVATLALPAGATPVPEGAALSPDGTRVAVVTSRGVTVLDAASGRALVSTALPRASRVTFVGDATRIVVATRDGALGLRDATTLRARASLEASEDFAEEPDEEDAEGMGMALHLGATPDGTRVILRASTVRIVEVGASTLREVLAVDDEFTLLSDDAAWLRTSADIEQGDVYSTADGSTVYSGVGDFASAGGTEAVCERGRLTITASGASRGYGRCDRANGRLFVSPDGRFVIFTALPAWLGTRVIRVADGLELRITILGERGTDIALERSDGRVDALGDRVLFLRRAAGPLVGATMTPVPRDPTLLADFLGSP